MPTTLPLLRQRSKRYFNLPPLRNLFSNWNPSALASSFALKSSAAAFLLLTLVPLAACFSGDGRVFSALNALEPRTFSLLSATFKFSAAATAFSLLLALPVALFLWQSRFGKNRLWLAFLMLLPPYLHAQGFSALAANPPPGLGFLRDPDGIYWAAFVGGVAMAPMTALLVSLAPFFLPTARIESARLTLSPKQIFCRLVFPATLPLILAATAITFIQAILEGGLPLSLQTPVFATEITTRFLAGDSAAQIITGLWPLLLLIAPAILMIIPWVKILQRQQSFNRKAELMQIEKLPFFSRTLLKAGLIVSLFCIGLPLIGLLRQALASGAGLSTGPDGMALYWTILTAICCATLCTIISLRLGSVLDQGFFLPVLMVVTLVIPSSLTGIAWATLGTKLSFFPQELIMVLGHCSRALPLTLLLSFFCWKSFSRRRQLESACLLPHHFRLRLRLEAPIATVCFCVAGVISLRELEVSLLTVAPGSQTLPLRIYSLMHYGAGTDVARLSLALALSLAIAAAIMVKRWPK